MWYERTGGSACLQWDGHAVFEISVRVVVGQLRRADNRVLIASSLDGQLLGKGEGEGWG